MKSLKPFRFDAAACQKELDGFKSLLAADRELGESSDILPFFRENEQLSAFLGSYHPSIHCCDLIAFEFQLFGDYACDLVVGDSNSHAYLFVEFEDAKSNSLFVKKRRETPEWSPRFEHGFGQLVDWLHKLDDLSRTQSLRGIFGAYAIMPMMMLAIGRNSTMGTRERDRLAWRQEKVLVDSRTIYCKTFDMLHADLQIRLNERLKLLPAPGRGKKRRQ
jgi:hypothetical protein